MRQALPFQIATLAAAIALTACGGDSGSSSSSNNVGLANKDAGTAIISAQGGSGTSDAGDGGYVNILKGNAPGALNVSVNGTPDTDYELPEYTINLGPQPATVTSSVTVKPYSGDELATGELYMRGSSLFKYDGEIDGEGAQVVGTLATLVTGLEVAAGATLTLASSSSTFYLYLSNDLVNNGVITTANILAEGAEDTDARPNLEINTTIYSGSGSFDLTGFSADYPNGRNLDIYANIIANGGSINTSGYNASEEDATNGGNAGDVTLSGYLLTENSGTITADGGNSGTGYAGVAGDIDLEAQQHVVNTAAISANSGAGANAYQYNFGSVDLSAVQNVINTGAISVQGASATDAEGSSYGGEGGYVRLTSYPVDTESSALAESQPRLVNTGSIDVSGGKTAAELMSGRGGNIYITMYESSYGAEGVSNPGYVAISGNLIANGGGDVASYYGGRGGNITLTHYATALSEQPTQLVGYNSINVSGGSANDAGNAGAITIRTQSAGEEPSSSSYIYAAAAPLNVETDLTANGGNALYDTNVADNGYAGRGGIIAMVAMANNNTLQAEIVDATVSYSGAISLNGGNATGFAAQEIDYAYGGEGGYATFYATQGISAEGSLSANGGASDSTGDDTTAYYGGGAGVLEAVTPQGAADIALDITLNGASGANGAGSGGIIWVTAADKVTLDGDITATGGNADSAIEDSVGGFGGQITTYSVADKYKLNEDATLTAGSGDQTPWAGGIQQGGTCIVGNCSTSVMMGPI